MAGPKKQYKIQIIKAGIGDPLIAACFQFINDPNYDNPEEYPVENLNLKIYFTYQTTSGTTSSLKLSGSADMANFGTLNYYYLTFPFDQPSDINLDQANISMQVDAIDTQGEYTVDFENGGTGYMAVALTDEVTPVAFANLYTKYTYCPGGECIELGIN